jgi:hypothetical protein
MIKWKAVFILFAIYLCAIKSNAVMVKLDLLKDNQLVDVNMPFLYYQRDDNDNFFFLHQNSYAVFDAEDDINKVIVTGPLQPCIAVAITNGKKLLLFHVNPFNSLQDMAEIIRRTFCGEDKNNIYAGIYGLNAENAWKQARWGMFYMLHEEKTDTAITQYLPNYTDPNYIPNSHGDFVKAIKANIEQSEIYLSHIKTHTWNLEQNAALENTIYSHSQHNICIKMNNLLNDEQERNINIFSISLMENNLFNVADEHISVEISPMQSFSGRYKYIQNSQELYKDENIIRSLLVKGFYCAFEQRTKKYLDANINGWDRASINSLNFIHQKI